MSRIAIIGAGCAGLAAAWSLRTAACEVTVFEKSRGFSGRAATRGRYGVRYDHGANYFKPTSDRVERLVREHLPTDDLVDIGRDVWTFDAEGTVAPGRDGDAPKWTYRQGISTLGKLLARRGSAVIHTETRVERLDRSGDTWTVVSDENDGFGPFDAVLLTPPAPQTEALLRASAVDGAAEAVLGGLQAADYSAQFTVVLAYDRRIRRPGDFYALINTDREHAIAWMSFEQDKPGHVPEGNSVLIVQMAPHWTADRLETDPDVFVPDVKSMAADVLDADLRRPSWYDTQRWRYALPTAPADADALDAGREVGLFFAGDYVAGKGRVGRALETGLDAADALRDAFSL